MKKLKGKRCKCSGRKKVSVISHYRESGLVDVVEHCRCTPKSK